MKLTGDWTFHYKDLMKDLILHDKDGNIVMLPPGTKIDQTLLTNLRDQGCVFKPIGEELDEGQGLNCVIEIEEELDEESYNRIFGERKEGG